MIEVSRFRYGLSDMGLPQYGKAVLSPKDCVDALNRPLDCDHKEPAAIYRSLTSTELLAKWCPMCGALCERFNDDGVEIWIMPAATNPERWWVTS